MQTLREPLNMSFNWSLLKRPTFTRRQTLVSIGLVYLALLCSFLVVGPYVNARYEPCGGDMLPQWVVTAFLIITGAEIGSLIIHVNKLYITRRNGNSNVGVAILILMTILTSLISVSLEISPIGRKWFPKFICENVHGEKTSIFMWMECTINVPLLFFLYLSYGHSKIEYFLEDFLVMPVSAMFVISQFAISIKELGIEGGNIIPTTLSIISASFLSMKKSGKIGRLNDDSNPVNLYDYLLISIAKGQILDVVFLSFPYLAMLFICTASFPNPYAKFVISRCVILFSRIAPIMFTSLNLMKRSKSQYNELKSLQKMQSVQRHTLRYIFHEVRVPMQSIGIANQLMDKEMKKFPRLHELCQDTLSLMTEQLHYLAHTLNDVLVMQKIEEGKLIPSSDKFNISEHLNGITSKLKNLLNAKGIILKTVVDSSVPMAVIGDKFRIEHVLLNLLENSVRYSPRNSMITVNVRFGIHAPGFVTYSIKDQGIPIDEAMMNALFDKHSQDSDTSIGSSRIALAICKEIVSLYDGDLGCNSIKDVEPGNEFYFSFPVNLKQSKEGFPESPLSSLEVSPRCSTNEKFNFVDTGVVASSFDFVVLAVDDSVVNRRMLAKLLESLGIQVDIACDGLEFIESMKAKHIDYYDIVFCDRNMPNMDGAEAVSEVRKLGYKRVIVGLTGDTSDKNVESFLEAGADTIMSKPIDINVLKTLLSSVKSVKPNRK